MAGWRSVIGGHYFGAIKEEAMEILNSSKINFQLVMEVERSAIVLDKVL